MYSSTDNGAPEPAAPQKKSAQHRRLRFIAFVGAAAGLLFGYDLGVFSGALLFLSTDWNLTAWEQGIITSAMPIGATITAFMGGNLADKFGRRRLLQTGGTLFFLGALGCAVAPGLDVMLAARFTLGLGLGITSTIVPVFLGEIAPTNIRGRLISTNTVMMSTGQMASTLVNAALGFTGSWQLMLACAVLPAVLLLIALFFITDTPTWYVEKGEIQKARDVLERTRDPEDARLTLCELEENAKLKNRAGRLSDFFKEKWLRRTLLIGVCVGFINQLGGISAVTYFAPTLFRIIGFGDQGALNVNVLVGLVTIAAAMTVGVFVIDRFPRRLLLGIGTGGVAVTMAAMGIAFGFIDEGGDLTAGWVFLGLMLLYLVMNQGFLSVTTWAIPPEIFPGFLRGQGAGITNLCLWGSNFVLSLIFLPVLETIGGRATFLCFAGINVLALAFTLFILPETLGKSLVQIEGEARRRHGAIGATHPGEPRPASTQQEKE
jgi:major inositol transporter-like SP family MFS transporter